MMQDRKADGLPMVRVGLMLASMLAIGMSGGIMLQDREADERGIVALRRLEKNRDDFAEVGDLIEIGMDTDAFDGPFDLKIAIRGDGVKFRMKPIVVFAPGPRPDPNEPNRIGPPDEIRAYFTVEGTGDVTFVVTPVLQSGKPMPNPILFPIKISREKTLRLQPAKIIKP